MLQEMTAEEFDERFAWYLISGEGENRHLAAMIAATVANQVTRYLSAKTGTPLKPEQMMTPDDFLPSAFRAKQPKTSKIKATDANAAERAAKQLGLL